jgi:hypothetical protein
MVHPDAKGRGPFSEPMRNGGKNSRYRPRKGPNHGGPHVVFEAVKPGET